MKKIFLFLMFIATFAFGAQTNLFDNIKVNNSIVDSGSLTVAGVSTFNGLTIHNGVMTNNAASVFNGFTFFNGGGVWAAGTTMTNNGTAVFSNIIVRGSSTFTGPATFNGVVSNNSIVVDNGPVFIGAGGSFTNNGDTTLSNLLVRGNLTVNGNTTLGDAAADTITVNASTTSQPNGMNYSSGVFSLPASVTGTITNGANVFATSNITLGTVANIVIPSQINGTLGIISTLGTGSTNTLTTGYITGGTTNIVAHLGTSGSSFLVRDRTTSTIEMQIGKQAAIFMPIVNSNIYFQVQNTGGTRIFNIDTTGNGKITLGSNGVATAFSYSIYTNASLGFPTALLASQVEEKSFTLSGAVAGDPVVSGWPATLPSDSVWQMWCSNVNTIIVRRIAIVTTSAYTNTFSARQIVQ